MFKIILKKKAEKFLQKVDKPTVKRLANALLDLKYDLGTGDIKPLAGKYTGLCRLRVGDLRIIFLRDNKSQEITVYDINNRGDVY